MITQQLSPKLESAILALSPQEQLQVIMILLQTLLGWSEEKAKTISSASTTVPETHPHDDPILQAIGLTDIQPFADEVDDLL